MGFAGDEIESPQRYERDGCELVCVTPGACSSTGTESMFYTRRIRRAGSSQVHAVHLPPQSTKPPSSRADGIVVLIVSGSMKTDIEGGPSHLCQPLSLTYHPPGEAGTGRVGPEGATMLVASLGSDRSLELVAEGLASKSWTELELTATAMTLLREFSILDANSELIIEELALQLFTASSNQPNLALRKPRWWRSLTRLLEDDLAQSITLSEIAGELGLHPSYLCSTYRHHTGGTIGGTLRRRRVLEAARLVVENDAPLGAIAADFGFADQSHFIRVFKRVFGALPSQMREARAACQTDLLIPRSRRNRSCSLR